MSFKTRYTKLRKSFGRQPLFQDVPAQMLDSIYPNKQDQKFYMLRNPVNRYVQATAPLLSNETNTKQLVTHEQGVNHTEGGWPREVHLYNEEHIARHRRRVMHDENYIHTVLNLAPVMKHYLDQNNAIEMYETYFADMNIQQPVEKYNVRINNVFRDTNYRPISCIAWTNEKKSRLAVAYCDRNYNINHASNKINTCYLWDVSLNIEPAHQIDSDSPCWQLACSPKQPEIILGGLENGSVCVFDIRESNKAVSSSSIYNSHRNPVTALLYTHSRTQTEFFSGSPDGQCLWWDERNLSEPISQLPMSIKIPPGETPNLANAEGVSALEFDHGFPTKFLCGTESGYVINVNRLGRIHSEILTCYWDAHAGPVRTVRRSPCTSRMFLTCGDYTVRIWSEEVRTAPIIVSQPYHYQVTDAVWAPLRYSSYMSVCAGGFFYYWDLLRKTKEPVATLQVSKDELTKVVPHVKGHSVAIGNNSGSVYLVSLPENMTLPDKRNKQLMFQTYERETRREHILDNRVKEIHLKQRATVVGTQDYDSLDEEKLIKEAEDEYFRIVSNELQQLEVTSNSTIAV